MKKMVRESTRRVTRSRSGLVQINGGEVTPTLDKSLQVSQASNVSESVNTPEATSQASKEANGKAEECNGVAGEGQARSLETGEKSCDTKMAGLSHEVVVGLPCRGQFEIHRSRMSPMSSKRLGGGGDRNVLFSSHTRAQRSKEAVASASVAATNPAPVGEPKKRKKYTKKGKVKEDDEYTRIKKKLRYFLNRINYEQNLIDAYSLEGWKGSSMEKLRPEKELERAKKEILRRKVKIRDLFQHLDTLCAEGSLPESLFDSEGEICSEDIFCAKCGSKDLPLDNDIILCDGFCDRGFHQYCVEPPLLKEDIPPDDESWLCPGCDCKDDCLGLLNDSLGTKLTISDTWEKVFPEAAAALAGGDQTLNCDLPSDDSDDEEYDPHGLNDKENDKGGSDEDSENEDGSSDESDCTSASDEMIESFKEGKDILKDIMNLPSDDSEDDDFDYDEDKKQESSNSDCSSDSEDPEASLKGEESKLPDVPVSESGAELDQDLADVPGKRNVERLDYKKLYDDEYENVPTSSSDDEDWDKTAGKEDFESADEENTVPLKQSSEAEDRTSTKKPRRTSTRTEKKKPVKASEESPVENGCSGEKSSSSTNKKTNPKTQRLFKSFQENRYPDSATRELLAKELQMTIKQVDNWFRNRRSSTSKPLVTMVTKEDVEKLTSGQKKGETSVAGSSQQAMETDSAVESTNPGSRKRRRTKVA